MRKRPSRQGLIPVCTSGINILAADLFFQEKGVPFALPFPSYVYFLLLLSSSFMCGAQDLHQEVHHYFDEIRKEHFPPTAQIFSSIIHEDKIPGILQPFLKDSTNRIREKAYQLIYIVSSNSANKLLRSEGVITLLRACSDQDSGIRTTALHLLKEFKKNDFNPAAKDSLRKLIRSKASPLDRLIKLAGFHALTDLIPDIRHMSQAGNPPQLRWAALQSLARMEQSDAVRDMMERVKRLPVNDDLVYNVFPDLIFTRQREPIAYMIEALQSGQKNCLSADIEREVPIPCGYRIMEQLAPVIDNFPVAPDESGDLKTRDYPAALDRVRQWFSVQNNFTILNDRY